MNTVTKRCSNASCGQAIPDRLFRCPKCGTLQGAGQTFTRTTAATRLVPGGCLPAICPTRGSSLATVASAGPRIQIAAIAYSDGADLQIQPSPPEMVSGIALRAGGSTNGAAALRMARGVLFPQGNRAASTLGVILMSDGDMTAGGAFLFGPSHSEAAIQEAEEIKKQGAYLATVFFDGPTQDRECLRRMATSPGLFFECFQGGLAKALCSASRTILEGKPSGPAGSALLIFCLDVSGSMEEGNKLKEVEAAFLACIQELRGMNGMPMGTTVQQGTRIR